MLNFFTSFSSYAERNCRKPVIMLKPIFPSGVHPPTYVFSTKFHCSTVFFRFERIYKRNEDSAPLSPISLSSTVDFPGKDAEDQPECSRIIYRTPPEQVIFKHILFLKKSFKISTNFLSNPTCTMEVMSQPWKKALTKITERLALIFHFSPS